MKEWQPVKASQSGTAFSHLLFADNLVLFAKADHVNCTTIREVLDVFCGMSGKTISEAKSRVYFSPNVDDATKETLSDVLGLSPLRIFADIWEFLLSIPDHLRKIIILSWIKSSES